MRLIFLTYLFFISCGTLLKAQLLVDKVIPPSPNAAAIMKYCDHPVGKLTGIQRIKIPLHTIGYNDIVLPINLSYHPLGIKVEEEATWVGLGWNLNAGGVITRLVRGKNDLGVAESELGVKALGYPFENIKPCLDDCPERKTKVFRETVCNGLIDTDPDVFFFDIFGARGKFLLTSNHGIDDKQLTINLDSKRGPMVATFTIATNTWEVKTESGFSYLFKTREFTETQRHYFDYKLDSHKLLFEYYSDVATTSWYLDQVTSPTGMKMYFDYDVSNEGKSLYGTNGTHMRMNINDQDTWDVHYSHYCFPEIENVQILSENMFNNVYLKSIRYGSNSIQFIKSGREDMHSPARENRPRLAGSDYALLLDLPNEPQKLDKIIINEGGNRTSFDFKYDYFNKATTDSIPKLYKRLKLTGLTQTADDITFPPFAFHYMEEFSFPSKESHARDLWGYYNGEEDIRNITPSDYFNYNQPERLLEIKGRTRHFSEVHEMTGLLRRIDYPTKRSVEYEYESQDYHTVSPQVAEYYGGKMDESNFAHSTDPFVSGGLRIKRLKEIFPADELIKDFDYNNLDGITSGELTITPFNHDHESFGHKTSGNHYIKYKKVRVKSGKIHKGEEFLFRKN